MFSEKHYPEEVKGELLDSYLAKGWYRMGQSIFTTHFLCFGSDFYSALWVRLPLAGYEFSKSLRKLKRKNEKQFRISYNKAFITAEKEALYLQYKKNFPAPLSPSLKESLLDLEEKNIFDTYEVCIYDNNQLIACSFFDLGNNSAASILGIYDPKYSKNSLGLYTMILEILFCQKKGLTYYYPGYVVPGNDRFNYKLRIGNVDYYEIKTNTWIPYKDVDLENTPIIEMTNKLLALRAKLMQNGMESQLKYYPMFEANLVAFSLTTYFDYPILLELTPGNKSDNEKDNFFLVVYNTRSNTYQLLHCLPFDSPFFYFKSEFIQSFKGGEEKFLLRLITISSMIVETKDIAVMAEQIVDFIRVNQF